MYMGGEDGVVMGLCVHVCMPGLTQDIDHLLSKMLCVCGVSVPEYTICAQSDLHSCRVRTMPKYRRQNSLKCQYGILRGMSGGRPRKRRGKA